MRNIRILFLGLLPIILLLLNASIDQGFKITTLDRWRLPSTRLDGYGDFSEIRDKKIDFLFLGTSRLCRAIDQKFIEDTIESRLKRRPVIYRICIIRNHFDARYFLLKRLLKLNSVRMVIVEDRPLPIALENFSQEKQRQLKLNSPFDYRHSVLSRGLFNPFQDAELIISRLGIPTYLAYCAESVLDSLRVLYWKITGRKHQLRVRPELRFPDPYEEARKCLLKNCRAKTYAHKKRKENLVPLQLEFKRAIYHELEQKRVPYLNLFVPIPVDLSLNTPEKVSDDDHFQVANVYADLWDLGYPALSISDLFMSGSHMSYLAAQIFTARLIPYLEESMRK